MDSHGSNGELRNVCNRLYNRNAGDMPMSASHTSASSSYTTGSYTCSSTSTTNASQIHPAYRPQINQPQQVSSEYT